MEGQAMAQDACHIERLKIFLELNVQDLNLHWCGKADAFLNVEKQSSSSVILQRQRKICGVECENEKIQEEFDNRKYDLLFKIFGVA